ncbi:HAD family hydrolase [Vibrio sp. SS-MA-C1-2]|uniref:HAD hydrolase family protein n=1 Tax=Vibrio sp. SS-MA-C1-2 TaxID=2908646 RepID=UPI001F18CABB|nr:HAD hydrolase family protein [Vibrio sp. SS-MA-C1-2]UJF18484.1 HAD family hydrolase [Vibrio sp. SS-MA-C1-2]
MNKSILVLNLEYSLLENEVISNINMEAIQLAQDDGHIIVITTSRSHYQIEQHIIDLNISAPVICLNGAYQYDFNTRETKNSQSLSSYELKQVVEQFNFTSIKLYTLERYYTFTPNTKNRLIRFIDKNLKDIDKINKDNIYKIEVSLPQPDPEVTKKLRTYFEVIERGDTVELMPKYTNKLESVKNLCLQHPNNHLITVLAADQSDEVLLEFADNIVTFIDSPSQIKKQANHIIKTHPRNGIAQYIRSYLQEQDSTLTQ